MWERMSGAEKVVSALIAFFMINALFSGEPGLFVLLVIIGVAFAMRNSGHQTAYREPVDYEDEAYEPVVRRERPANAEQIHQHALRAVRRANLDPNNVSVLPVDIGLIVFRGEERFIHHNRPVDDDIDYVLPFVQLRVPVAASGRVKFEILDNTGQKVYAHEEKYELKRGRNLVLPSTRLPIHDEQEMDGRWELRITADNIILARHVFEWASSGSSDFHKHIAEDGEISSALRAVLAEARLQEMSLDELLAHQEEDSQQQTRR